MRTTISGNRRGKVPSGSSLLDMDGRLTGTKAATGRRTPKPPRHGYALMLVLMFIIVYLVILGIAYRGIASALRVATAHAQRIDRDEGSIPALACGLELLESGQPPSDPYVCGVLVTTSHGPQSFTLTFNQVDNATWNVTAGPTVAGSNPPVVPSTFAPAAP